MFVSGDQALWFGFDVNIVKLAYGSIVGPASKCRIQATVTDKLTKLA